MAIRYRLGWPFGSFIAQLGCPVAIRVDVIRDEEAGVYIGTSVDIDGLVVEAETLDALRQEAHEVILTLLELNHRMVPANSITRIRFNENIACA